MTNNLKHKLVSLCSGLNDVPPEDIPESYSGTCEWDLIWIYRFGRCNEIGGIPYLESALNQTSDVLKEKVEDLRYTNKEETQRETHMKMKAKTEDMQPQAEKCQRLMAATRRQEKGMTQTLVRLQSEPILTTNPNTILSLDLWPPE